jgi:hypothetical protein
MGGLTKKDEHEVFYVDRSGDDQWSRPSPNDVLRGMIT